MGGGENNGYLDKGERLNNDNITYFNQRQVGIQLSTQFLLYGFESASQKTIDRLNKNIKIAAIEEELREVKRVNGEVKGHLEPHLTFMVGYPWETREEAEKTIQMTKDLFSKLSCPNYSDSTSL